MLQACGWLIGVPLQFLVVAALLRGAYRRFPFIFLYAAANLVVTLVEIPFTIQMLNQGGAAIRRQAALIYWVDETVLQVLVFTAVISLMYQANSGVRLRRIFRTGSILGALLYAGISLALHYSPAPVKYGVWMTPWTRDLNFGAAVLDLALWMMLLGSKERDRTLLLISGALGMQFTGEAIGAAIRDFSVAHRLEALAYTGSAIVMLADLTCLYVWWQTFRRPAGNPDMAEITMRDR